MDIIRLNNIEIYAFHGVKPEEKKLGQIFQIDVDIFVNKLSSISDSIDDTIDYEKISKLITDNFNKSKYNLLETIAEKISDKILQIPKIIEVKIRIRKPSVSLNSICRSVEIEISRKK